MGGQTSGAKGATWPLLRDAKVCEHHLGLDVVGGMASERQACVAIQRRVDGGLTTAVSSAWSSNCVVLPLSQCIPAMEGRLSACICWHRCARMTERLAASVRCGRSARRSYLGAARHVMDDGQLDGMRLRSRSVECVSLAMGVVAAALRRTQASIFGRDDSVSVAAQATPADRSSGAPERAGDVAPCRPPGGALPLAAGAPIAFEASLLDDRSAASRRHGSWRRRLPVLGPPRLRQRLAFAGARPHLL